MCPEVWVVFVGLTVVRVLRVLRCGVVCTGVVVDPSVLGVVCLECVSVYVLYAVWVLYCLLGYIAPCGIFSVWRCICGCVRVCCECDICIVHFSVWRCLCGCVRVVNGGC